MEKIYQKYTNALPKQIDTYKNLYLEIKQKGKNENYSEFQVVR